MRHNKSFTLIELLVVIAVIGLISSLVLVSIKTPRQKAKIAKLLEFGQSIQNALGSEAVGIWNFDEGSGATAKDSSGYGNNGTLYNFISPYGYTDDTPQKIVGTAAGKYALSFNGAGDYVEVPHSPSLNNVFGTTQFFTLEAWAYPRSWVDWTSLINKATGGYWSNVTAGIWASDEGFCAAMGINALGNPSNCCLRVCNKPSLNQWYHIVASANGEKLSLYINGRLINSVSIWAGLNQSANTDPVTIGIRCIGCSPYFHGLIDEVRIYSQALSALEIQKRYAEGLKTHKNLATKPY